MIELEDGSLDIDADKALKSGPYSHYISAAAELTVTSIHNLTVIEKACFFLNVYQCMYIHCLLKQIHDGEITEDMSQGGMVKNIKSLVWKDK